MLYHTPLNNSFPKKLSLANNTVHLWQFINNNENSSDTFLDLLSADELAKADRFKFDIDRKRYITAHGLLRYLLAHYLVCKPHAISFDVNKYGKPHLVAPFPRLQFNISHSQHAFLFGFSHQAIGVDIEFMRTDIQHLDIAKRFFTTSEHRQLLNQKNGQQNDFYRLWACKEAVVKGLGCGIAQGLNEVELKLELDDDITLLQIQNSFELTQQWSLYELQGSINYSAAFATQEKNPIIKYHQLSLSDLNW